MPYNIFQMLADVYKKIAKSKHRDIWIGSGIACLIAVVFLVLAQRKYFQDLNYTFVLASSLLQGHLGVYNVPSWLNEMIPVAGGIFYSAFPLGSIISVMPLSALVLVGILQFYPVNLVVALLAGGCAAMAYAYTGINKRMKVEKRIMLALWLVAGTWFMTNLLFAGAWQIALGFAVLGELGALYWSIVKPRPFLAGLALAIAFGNRTEVILIAPIILAFLLRPYWKPRQPFAELVRRTWPLALKFCAIPVILGVATLLYNHARFGSYFDFGYARIPGVLDEYLYRDGIFSINYIANNAREMLFQSWISIPDWPYWRPTGFGGSILLASPFLFLLFRNPKGDRFRVRMAWVAIVILTTALWVHGNPGGWQYSYRYAMILLPWVLVLFTEYLPDKIMTTEAVLWLLSVVMSGYATYLFLYSGYMGV